MEVFVFSYNRGVFLKNCVESIRRHAKGMDVTIIDDGSDDEKTKNVLDDLAREFRVITRVPDINNFREGGFYKNLEDVIRIYASKDYALFIEDDMQLVRDLRRTDMSSIKKIFNRHPEICQINATFGKYVYSGAEKQELDQSHPKYFLTSDSMHKLGPKNFCTNGVFHITRMREVGFKTATNKNTTSRLLLGLGVTKYAYYSVPFMHWLPWPSTQKYKTDSILRKIVEWKHDAGFYPYKPLSREAINALFERTPNGLLPMADDYLETYDPHVKRPLDYMDSMKRTSPLVRKIDNLEVRLRGALKKK